MAKPDRSSSASHWQLDADTVFLNHGSFGACPSFILADQRRFRDMIENEPVRFFEREAPLLLKSAFKSLAIFLNADPSDLAFVQNATAGVNTILRSLQLEPDDEILVPDHAYQACRNAIDFVTTRAGAKTIVCEIPFPIDEPQQAFDAVMSGVTNRTRLVMLDVITSATGVLMPYKRLVSALESRGIEVLLDAAHAPGMVELELDSLGASYTTGNCHKWMCAPKGTAFIHVRKDLQTEIRPLSISHGMTFPLGESTRFRHEFDWVGTTDPSSFLCLPSLIEGMSRLHPQGWDGIMQHNHNLVLAGRQVLCEALAVTPPCPSEMIGSIAAIRLPIEIDSSMSVHQASPLHDILLDDYGIQVPVWYWSSPKGIYLRISAQLYNHLDEYHYLAESLLDAMDNL